MKRKPLNCTLLIIVACLLLTSCEYNGNRRPFSSVPEKTKLSAPVAIALGTNLYWGIVKDAISYTIYNDNQIIDTTTENFYTLKQSDQDETYSIVANSETYLPSDPTTIIVDKSTGFKDNEVLDLSDDTLYYSGEVESSIKLIKLGKDKEYFRLDLLIKNRTNDLYIEMENVDLVGSIKSENDSYSYAKNSYSLIINYQGDCSFRGKNGASGLDYANDSSYNNKELDGVAGTDGDIPIIFPSLVINGNGNFALNGGNGGNGGSGSSVSSSGMGLILNTFGKGSNGGNGAAALKTDFFVLNLENESNSLTLTNGKGGTKGEPGHLIYGLITTPTTSPEFDIGKDGTDGVSTINTIIKRSGELIYA